MFGSLFIKPKPTPRIPRHGANTGAVLANAPNIPFAAFVKYIHPLAPKPNRLNTSDVAFPNISAKTVDGTTASTFRIGAKIIRKKERL